ncbi:MAG: SGNH/GDSL hydrolase family protein [Acutalibacteraceae bacterium]|nr:SGNH/GDSL hydrolase family protein [Acutalibacteraceae bacterium]
MKKKLEVMEMELKGAKINFLGDSITEGSGSSCTEKRYTNLIAQKTGAVCNNYGIGGTRIAEQLKPSDNPIIDKTFGSRVCEMETDADCIIVFGGTNDFGHGDAPLGSMEDRTTKTFYGALHSLCISLIEKYPTAKIGILTPFHRCNEDNLRGDGSKEFDAAPLKTYVEIIREVAEYYSLPVLDLFKCSGLQPKIPIIKEMYMPDGLHPNDRGYELLADKIIKFIETL